MSRQGKKEARADTQTEIDGRQIKKSERTKRTDGAVHVLWNEKK